MSAAEVLARGREFAAELMVDTCEIVAVTGTHTDLGTGQAVEDTDVVYAGPCRVQQADPIARAEMVGEADRLMVTRLLWLPVATSVGVRAGQRVQITVCQYDPDVVGRRFVVRAEFGKTHATARRLGIEEVTS
ncbi:DUF6093 family protein [Plantactinospora sp. CA-294935]|uniref:DUF6093 family protein n=1 Tax=Plantactinospora sp. CA-294935 TaxID=3240012 RepID=UPI003D8E0B2A